MRAPACVAAARRRPAAAGAVLLLCAGAAAVDAHHGKPGKGAAYLAAMLLAVLAADLLAARSPPPEPFPIRRPGREGILAALFTVLGMAALGFRYSGEVPWEERARLHRLLAGLAMVAFTFPTALALYLLADGYRPRALGFRLRGLAAGAAALLLAAGTASLVDPGQVTLWRALEGAGGWGGLLLLGASAAIPEEFLRFVLQTRWGASLRSPAAGWILATLVWAALHVPNFAAQAGGDAAAGALGALRIVPVGLLWGYLTRRTGSLLPAVLAHGLNFWGLQNS